MNRTGRKGQIQIYLGKLFRIFFNEKDWKLIPFAAIIALMVGFVVGNSMFVNMEGTRIGALAFVCVSIWNGFFNSIQTVCKERAIIKREHRAGLHISAYIMANMIYQAILCLIQTVVSILVYALIGVQFPTESLITGVFLIDLGITLFLISYAADMMALMVSCIVRTTTSAMTIMPFLLIFQLVFASIAFPLSGNAAKVSNVTISKWGVYAICTQSDYNSQPSNVVVDVIGYFKKEPMIKDLLKFLDQDELAQRTGKYLQNKHYTYTPSNVLKDWGILLGDAALYALIGTVILEFIDHDRR